MSHNRSWQPWQRRVVIQTFPYLGYVFYGAITLVLAFLANLAAGVLLLLNQDYTAGAIALIISPLPLVSSLIAQGVGGYWLPWVLNVPHLVFWALLPLVIFIYRRLRAF